MTCSGATSWYGFAEAIFARATELLGGRKPEVNAIPTSAYPTPATRPRNSVLSNAKLQARFGLRLLVWQEALDLVMQQIAAESTKKARG
jgi:dTDP-4-dehydrorhamnose reductase